MQLKKRPKAPKLTAPDQASSREPTPPAPNEQEDDAGTLWKVFLRDYAGRINAPVTQDQVRLDLLFAIYGELNATVTLLEQIRDKMEADEPGEAEE